MEGRPHNHRSYLNNNEFKTMLDILSLHPESEGKIGCGVKRIFVAKHGEYPSYCFHVEREDRSVEDFSYRYALGR